MDIYYDIANRSNGNIYIGVVGPVRTGKSTFIAGMMDKLVLPYVENEFDKKRVIDDIPQSADGKTVMTTQPKFVPSEAVSVNFGENITANVRFVDCVGYIVNGALGIEEDGKERMVFTPWQEDEIPFSQAAEIGTDRVIREHSNIAVVMTTDGSFGELSRESFIEAEERVIKELKECNRPFMVLLNTKSPESESVKILADALQEKYQVGVMPIDAKNISEETIKSIFKGILMEFPLRKICVKTPKWMRMLRVDNAIISKIMAKLRDNCSSIDKMKDYQVVLHDLSDNESIIQANCTKIDMSNGSVSYEIEVAPTLFYNELSNECGENMRDEIDMFRFIMSIADSKKKFDMIKIALEKAEQLGYGIMCADEGEMQLDAPVVIKQNGRYGVKMKTRSCCYHVIKTDVFAEVSPIVGSEQQSKYLVDEYEEDPKKLWEMNMFGKTLSTLAKEEIEHKVNGMSEELQLKLQRIVYRIINENKHNMFCFLL